MEHSYQQIESTAVGSCVEGMQSMAVNNGRHPQFLLDVVHQLEGFCFKHFPIPCQLPKAPKKWLHSALRILQASMDSGLGGLKC